MTAWAPALVALLAAGPGESPGPADGRTPVGPVPRVHVVASDSLSPDALLALARPEVTLWLNTTSNTLRASTLERLPKFTRAWVEVHEPVRALDSAQWKGFTRVGVWLTSPSVSAASIRRLGPRTVAASLVGALDEVAIAWLRSLHPAVVEWTPGAAPDLLAWSTLRSLTGARRVWFRGQTEWPSGCEEGAVSVAAPLEAVLAKDALPFPCGRSPLLEISRTLDPELTDAVRSRYPGLEFLIRVGASEGDAFAAARFIKALESRSF